MQGAELCLARPSAASPRPAHPPPAMCRRDQLQRCKDRLRVDIGHLSHPVYGAPELATALVESPAEYLPIFEEAAKRESQRIQSLAEDGSDPDVKDVQVPVAGWLLAVVCAAGCCCCYVLPADVWALDLVWVRAVGGRSLHTHTHTCCLYCLYRPLLYRHRSCCTRARRAAAACRTSACATSRYSRCSRVPAARWGRCCLRPALRWPTAAAAARSSQAHQLSLTPLACFLGCSPRRTCRAW